MIWSNDLGFDMKTKCVRESRGQYAVNVGVVVYCIACGKCKVYASGDGILRRGLTCNENGEIQEHLWPSRR